jgi:hypothetical protein
MRLLALAALCVAPAAALCQAKVTAFAVNLAWQAPASSPDPVAGYQVYRALAPSGTYTVVGNAALTPTAWSDLSIAAGVSYDYFVESVDAAGATSTPSNTVTVPVPALPPAMAQPTVTVNL